MLCFIVPLHAPCIDPSLTIENLTQLVDSADALWKKFSMDDHIPSEHLSGDEMKQALSKWYLESYPTPSWSHIADLLYMTKDHNALEKLKKLYLKGNKNLAEKNRLHIMARRLSRFSERGLPPLEFNQALITGKIAYRVLLEVVTRHKF